MSAQTISQTAFRAALLDGARPAPEGLTDGAGRPTTRRFNVYRNNVAVALTEALEQGFPVVRALVGEEFFKGLAAVYLRAHPPASPLMIYYGADLPAFIEGFSPAASLPYLPDIARLEFALRQSYHAADATPLEADALAQLPPEALESARLSFAPAVRLITSPWPVLSIWQHHHGGPKPQMAPEALLITRPGFDPAPHPVTPGAAPILAALIAGTPLGEAVAAGAEEEFPALLSLLLSQSALVALQT